MRCLISLFAASVLLFPAAMVAAQSEYGGGMGIMSLEAMTIQNSQRVQSQLLQGIAGRNYGPSDASGKVRSRGVAAETSGLFANALLPVDQGETVDIDTRFARSLAAQKVSEASILAEIKKRQPGAEAEYARVFAQQDMAKLFEKAVRGYGLRSDDIADTMAAYWLVSWVLANDAKDFSAAAARAVRDQVKAGIARTSVAGLSFEKKHRLADEAIFNTLIATQAFEYAQSGKISKADYRRLADVTQKAFLGLGADLRQMQLTDAGFIKR